MADRIAVINKGRLEQVGTPDELYAAPATLFVAGFIGSPPMNLLPVGPDGRGVFGRDARPDTTLGVRPEHLGLRPQTGEWTLDALVGLVEPTGKDRVVQATTLDGTPLTFRCEIEDTPRIGAQITLGCDPSAVHVYSTSTGQRLGSATERIEVFA
jgi:multiple sugar transport system ATP-binding protein